MTRTQNDLVPKPAPEENRSAICETILVDKFTDGILDPTRKMLGPVRDGGHIIATTAPGCWGPMLTPCLRGGHEVTMPVAVEGAEVGDAILIRVRDISVTSKATASGTDIPQEGRFSGDPYVASRCPQCGTSNQETIIEGIGPDAVHCVRCGAESAPFKIGCGYTIAFDNDRNFGVTLGEKSAETLAQDPKRYAAIPPNSIQNSVLAMAPHDLVGMLARLNPFLGQLGTTPAIAMPDSHNAGDFGQYLLNASHEYALTKEELARISHQ